MGEERETMKAAAEIRGEGIEGRAEFTEIEKGTQTYVKVRVTLKSDPGRLSPGKHACHIHEKAVCEAPFKSAGGHFDPGPASNTDPDVNHPYHMGDLPNLVVDHGGKGEMEGFSTRITLSDGPLSILSGGGTAMIIHEKEDPYRGGESGSGVSGGGRVACGVIRKA